jgi:hypothetical protein
MTINSEKAQKVYDAWEKEYCLKKPSYENRALAAAIREIVNEFQYYQCCEDEEDMVVDAWVPYALANELEGL